MSIRRHTPRSNNSQSSQSSGQKPRFGLPDGFIPRFHRYGRLVLLEENIYGLPNGKEFVPCRPTGTLASGRHLYALLSVAQFERGERGSVFIRLDGRVFDYSSDAVDPDRELFDTGYTIHSRSRANGKICCAIFKCDERSATKKEGEREESQSCDTENLELCTGFFARYGKLT